MGILKWKSFKVLLLSRKLMELGFTFKSLDDGKRRKMFWVRDKVSLTESGNFNSLTCPVCVRCGDSSIYSGNIFWMPAVSQKKMCSMKTNVCTDRTRKDKLNDTNGFYRRFSETCMLHWFNQEFMILVKLGEHRLALIGYFR